MAPCIPLRLRGDDVDEEAVAGAWSVHCCGGMPVQRKKGMHVAEYIYDQYLYDLNLCQLSAQLVLKDMPVVLKEQIKHAWYFNNRFCHVHVCV